MNFEANRRLIREALAEARHKTGYIQKVQQPDGSVTVHVRTIEEDSDCPVRFPSGAATYASAGGVAPCYLARPSRISTARASAPVADPESRVGVHDSQPQASLRTLHGTTAFQGRPGESPGPWPAPRGGIEEAMDRDDEASGGVTGWCRHGGSRGERERYLAHREHKRRLAAIDAELEQAMATQRRQERTGSET